MAGNTSVPRNLQDFGDGGAYPEIDIGQYPLRMGRKDSKPDQKVLPVTVDNHGNLSFDTLVKQYENASKIVTQYNDLVPKILIDEEDDNLETIEEEQRLIEETTLSTKSALEKIISARLSAVPKHSSEPEFIKYKPSQFKSGAKERSIRMVEMQADPLEPPKFKHKRIPKASGSPPVPIMHSPTAPVTVKDQLDWRIPPCVSNWKNPKGYTIPLEKRLAADGRGLQDVQISDKFAMVSEALYVSEHKSREDLRLRANIHKEKAIMEKERKEEELRELAAKARVERATNPSLPLTCDAEKRNKIREERQRERRLAKKSKVTRDGDRDVTEKIALGCKASAGGGGGVSRGEVMYDQRLFNQEKGINSGFATDDQYNLYDKALFSAQSTLSTLYKPKTDNQLKKTKSQPDRVFSGPPEGKGGNKRKRQVEFEKDPFDLDQFFTQLMNKATDTV